MHSDAIARSRDPRAADPFAATWGGASHALGQYHPSMPVADVNGHSLYFEDSGGNDRRSCSATDS